MNTLTRKEALAICEEMAKDLHGKWRPDIHGRQNDWTPCIAYDGVCLMQYDISKQEYTSFFSHMNYELESWEGKTPRAALKKLIDDYAKRVSGMKKRREELDIDIPLAEERHKNMLKWIGQ